MSTTVSPGDISYVHVNTLQISTLVSDVFAFKLDSGKNLFSPSMPTGANFISFWGYVDNTWFLYIQSFFAPFTGLYRNGSIKLTGDDFTILYQPSAFRITANGESHIADIRFHNITDISGGIAAVYAMLNKHPKTHSFGFYQLAHSSNIGIIGNQLDDSLIAFKNSDDDSFHLTDIQCNNLLSNDVYTKQQVDDNINNIDLSGKADASALDNKTDDSGVLNLQPYTH